MPRTSGRTNFAICSGKATHGAASSCNNCTTTTPSSSEAVSGKQRSTAALPSSRMVSTVSSPSSVGPQPVIMASTIRGNSHLPRSSEETLMASLALLYSCGPSAEETDDVPASSVSTSPKRRHLYETHSSSEGSSMGDNQVSLKNMKYFPSTGSFLKVNPLHVVSVLHASCASSCVIQPKATSPPAGMKPTRRKNSGCAGTSPAATSGYAQNPVTKENPSTRGN
mmetsp:Transcript_1816/g.5061  ORF Transcript_1816/g.5061 Transcript_1816/m.5061 type:complete len:224 (-) Transcript_1816:1161-1832(-)